MSQMTERDRLAHVLRRFGIGAGQIQVDRLEKLGFDRAKRLLTIGDSAPDPYPISHWEMAAQTDGNVDPNAYLVGLSWALRMLVTSRPQDEKLTLFWHDHFSVDADKIYEAPMMLAYLDILRTKGRGKFRDLLHAVIKNGAVIGYLDNHLNSRIAPNENFARELLELFTLGEGHYSEKDIKEIARAFTGWSFHFAGLGLEIKDYEAFRNLYARHKLSITNFCYVPALHDYGPKTILGRTENFSGETVLDMVANHPQTARHICEKLWNFYAGSQPSRSVIERLVQVWAKTDGEIGQILLAIADSPEFYAPEVVGQLSKCPVDWTIALFRNFGWEDIFLQLRGTPKDEFSPLKEDLRRAAGGLYYLMQQ